jgi:hypothetical protein
LKAKDYFVKTADVVCVVVACYGKIEFIDSEGCQVGVDYIVSLRGIPAINENLECVGSDKKQASP